MFVVLVLVFVELGDSCDLVVLLDVDEQREEAEEDPLVVPPSSCQHFSKGVVVSASDEVEDHMVAAWVKKYLAKLVRCD